MKRTVLFAVLFLSTISSQALAERGDHYWLADLGLMMVDNSDNPDNLTILGLKYGYGLTERLALETDYTMSLSGGAYEDKDINEDGEYSVWLLGVNAAYRQVFMENFYFKGKLGLSYGEQKRTNSEVSTEKEDVTSITGGLGVGFLAGKVVGSSLTAEAELTMHDSDLMSFTVGANVTF